MQNNEKLQSEVNSILTNSNLNNSNSDPIPTNNTQTGGVENKIENLETNQPIMAPKISAPEIESQLNLSKNSENEPNNKLLLFIPPLLVLVIIIVTLIVRYLGPRSFEQCVKDEKSEIYTLEPIYCKTERGKIFYQDGVERHEYKEDYQPQEEEAPDATVDYE